MIGKDTPEMRACLNKCIETRHKFRVERTDEALKELKEAEAERYRQYYKENRKGENERTTKWHKEQSKITVTCEICNIQLKKSGLQKHLQTLKHRNNLELQITPEIKVVDDKICRVCGETKPLERFRPRHATCRDCINTKKNTYRQTEEGHNHIREIEKKRDGIKMTCECGAIILKKHIARHRETIKHFEKIQSRS